MTVKATQLRLFKPFAAVVVAVLVAILALAPFQSAHASEGERIIFHQNSISKDGREISAAAAVKPNAMTTFGNKTVLSNGVVFGVSTTEVIQQVQSPTNGAGGTISLGNEWTRQYTISGGIDIGTDLLKATLGFDVTSSYTTKLNYEYNVPIGQVCTAKAHPLWDQYGFIVREAGQPDKLGSVARYNGVYYSLDCYVAAGGE